MGNDAEADQRPIDFGEITTAQRALGQGISSWPQDAVATETGAATCHRQALPGERRPSPAHRLIKVSGSGSL